MIIKGDLDRMAEDIGHAGKSQRAANSQGRSHFCVYPRNTESVRFFTRLCPRFALFEPFQSDPGIVWEAQPSQFNLSQLKLL